MQELGGGKCPSDYCIYMGSSPISNAIPKEKPHRMVWRIYRFMDHRPQPYGLRPLIHGLFPGLKNMSPACFLPCLRQGRPLRVLYHTKKKNHTEWCGFSFLCKYPNFEMLRPPGVVFSVKGGRFFCKGAVFSPRGVGIFTEGVTVVFMPINTQNRPLCYLMLAAVLFSFCWVGHEKVHKVFRLIPASLCLGLSAVWMHAVQSRVVLTYYYSAVISILMFLMLMVSMLPQKASCSN